MRPCSNGSCRSWLFQLESSGVFQRPLRPSLRFNHQLLSARDVWGGSFSVWKGRRSVKWNSGVGGIGAIGSWCHGIGSSSKASMGLQDSPMLTLFQPLPLISQKALQLKIYLWDVL